MNHIYRRIWNRAKQCWVVASEITSARGRKNARVARLVRGSLVLSMVTVVPAVNADAMSCSAHSSDPKCELDGNDVLIFLAAKPTNEFLSAGSGIMGAGQWSTTYGDAADAPGRYSGAFGFAAKAQGDYSAAFGYTTTVAGEKSAAFGPRARIDGVLSSAMGYRATAKGGHASAFGADSLADGIGSVAVGHDARALTLNSIAVGSGAKTNSGAGISKIAIGGNASAGTNGWTGAIALGGQTWASYDSVAIGYEAKAYAANATALGRGSVATEEATVSVGSASIKRRIVNVADARVNDSSTDAVAGKQLHATNKKLETAESAIGTVKSDVAAVRTLAQNASNRIDATNLAVGKGSIAEAGSYGPSTAIGSNAVAYNGRGVAVGHGARTGVDAAGNKLSGSNAGVSLGADAWSGNGAVAVGFNANASGGFAVVVGTGAQAQSEYSMAFGYSSKAKAAHAMALGTSSEADAQYAAALGYGARALSASSVAMGDRALANHRNAVALGAGSVTYTADSVSVGSDSLLRKIQRIADGTIAEGSTDAVTGNQLNYTNERVASVHSLASTAQSKAEAATVSATKALMETEALGGLVAQASASGSVRLGGGNSGTALDVRNSANANRRITGVADATLSTTSTDAVSGKQLNATNSNVTAARSVADTAKTNADSALTKANTLSGLLSQNSASGNVRLGAANSGTVLDVRNSANASRKITGVTDAALSSTSTDAVTGRQLNATNSNVSTALSDASAAKTTANSALTQVGTLNGLLSQASASGDVRVGERNSGTVLDVRNGANANRTLTGIADGVVGASSYEAVNGRQLNATNDKVATVEGIARSAGTEAAAAKTDAAKALAETAALGGLVAQASATGNVRLGEKNSGTTLDVRNSANANRKISGVADGLLSASSAEAVSGKQLHSTNSRVSDLEDVAQFVSIGSAPISERAAAGVAGVAVGNSAKTGLEGGTAVGTFAEAMGRNSTAIGRAASVSVDSENGFAMGVGAQVGGGAGGANEGIAIGAGARVGSGAHGSLALGNSSLADEEGVASFGGVGIQRRLVNIAPGTGDHNATTVSQLKDSLATLGGGAGMNASGKIITPTYTVQGGTQNTVEDALMALDGAVITAGRRADKVEGQLSSIFQGSPSGRADGMSQIALNGVNGMVLTNLADGRVAPGSRDAVTGNQLYAAEQKISQNRNDLEAMRKEREMGQQAMREMDANGPIDFGGARLTGVAEGKLSADSSDVVRGSQLYKTNSRVSALEGIGQYLSVGTAPEYGQAQAGPAGLAIGNLAKTGIEGGTAIGTFAKAMGRNSIALGRASTVYEGSDSSFAIGTGAEVGRAGEPGAIGAIAFGVGSRVEPGAHGSIAFGTSSHATEAGVVSFGNVGTKRRLVNIANGTANHNAATVGQLRGALSTLGGEVDANGNIVGPSFNVQGQTQSTLNGALEALDGAVVTNTSRVDKVETQLRSVFQDTPSVRADGTNQLTLAGANGMVISNVANGLIAAGSRDAVNGGQLHSMQQQLNGRMDGLEQRIDDAPAPRALASSSVPKPQTEEAPVVPEGKDSQLVASLGEGDKPTPQPKAKQDDTPKPQVDTAELEKMLARANEYTDGAISNFERRLDKMDKRFNRMAAMSSAQSAMAMNTAGLATYNRLGAGVGYSEGESAMAVGYQRVLNEKGSATFSLNGAFTNSGERSMGVGVGIGW
ncbi:ESPR-type extended signal peptide-containing protein [Stenotrophomonas maltophilia]|uniref:ESPR-type extended signal peptide-containing protein n=1 Tax=Stenotrophomonas maltophilia group sp. Smal13 TaxID=3377166 RepID=UPI0013129CA1|nr:ESPR-type extended signal peptide-containing protein [Stenotrophomonas maltophilia]EKU9959228.1 YadA-like family protein [Stenotrophomonas maltophilia]EKU9986101.1 YadA-like family protein [Stenotrophomonas maltophilia]